MSVSFIDCSNKSFDMGLNVISVYTETDGTPKVSTYTSEKSSDSSGVIGNLALLGMCVVMSSN